MKIVLVALAGSGKTTIMNYVRQKLPDVKIVNYGDIMLEIAKKKFGIEHRDEMRKKYRLKNIERFKKRRLNT